MIGRERLFFNIRAALQHRSGGVKLIKVSSDHNRETYSAEWERALWNQNPPIDPSAPHHLPSFVTLPGETDWLMTVMLVFLIFVVVSVGLIYLRLHALPEHMAHRTNKIQLQLVAVLALLALFTHNHMLLDHCAPACNDRAAGLLDATKLDSVVAREANWPR